MSQWETIYSHMKTNGFDVYSPGQHEGDCVAPYIVVRDEGTQKLSGFSSTQSLYDILCYVPQRNFSQLEPFVKSVKEAMKGLYPEFIPTYFETGSFLDETVKGHMISVQYRTNRKI